MKEPRTLLEAVQYFADPDVAEQYAAQVRWPNGVACPRMGCGSAHVAYLKNAHRWYCNECKRKFSAKVNSVFEDSPISFSKWLPAIWMLANDRNGISSCELARALGVTQKSAWFMLHRIRLAIQSGSFEKLHGEIEADETYIGGKGKGPNVGRRTTGAKSKGPAAGKTTVIGLMERGGKVRAFTVPDNKKRTLLPAVFAHVKPGSTMYTDSLRSYAELRQSYRHFIINHAERYVDGQVHTNNIENFWSVLKRTIAGTYIAPRTKHLDRYLDEQIYRFNAREQKDNERFVGALKGADSKRITYKTLIGK